MNAHDVIQFPVQEQADDAILRAVFERQCAVSLMALALAKDLYAARAAWIGGAMPWDELTVLGRASYLREVENLIKKAQGEQ